MFQGKQWAIIHLAFKITYSFVNFGDRAWSHHTSASNSEKRVAKIIPKLIVRFSVLFYLKEDATALFGFLCKAGTASHWVACLLKMLGKMNNFVLLSL